MNDLRQDILQRIGNTILLPLRNVAPKNSSRILFNWKTRTPRAT